MSTLFQSEGTIQSGTVPTGRHHLIVRVDPSIVECARSLVPRYLLLNKQKHPPHITLYKDARSLPEGVWQRFLGEKVVFEYRPEVQIGERYYWLEVYCTRLEVIRLELGTTCMSRYTRPPDGKDCFHITVGNSKKL